MSDYLIEHTVLFTLTNTFSIIHVYYYVGPPVKHLWGKDPLFDIKQAEINP